MRPIVAVRLALAALVLALLPSAARAASITSTWTGAVGTSWDSAGNWSNSDGSVRTPENAGGDTFSVSIPSATPRVSVVSATVSDISNGGTLRISHPGRSGGSLTATGTMTNEGRFEVGPAALQPAVFGHEFEGHLVNPGSIVIETAASLSLGKDLGQFTNTGSITIQPGAAMVFDGVAPNTGGSAPARITFNMNSGTLTNQGRLIQQQSDVFNLNGGTLDNQGDLILSGGTLNFSGGTFNNLDTVDFSTNTIPPNPPNVGTLNFNSGVLNNQGAVNLSGFMFSLNLNGGTLTGNPLNVSQAQGLNFSADSTWSGSVVAGTISAYSGDLPATASLAINSSLTAANGFTNRGTLQLSSASTSIARLSATTGALTNEQLLEFKFGAAGVSHTRELNTDVINTGAVTVETGTIVNLVKTNATFTMNGGTLNNQGTFTIDNGETLRFNGGTISGNPIIISGGRLTIGAGSTASGVVQFQKSVNTHSGDIPVAATIVLKGTSSDSASVVASSGFTNRGTIRWESVGITGGANLSISGAGVLTNEGTLLFQGGAEDPSNSLNSHLTNQGLIDVSAAALALLSKSGGVYQNQGTVRIGSGATLRILGSGTRTFTNQVGGVINGTGTFNVGTATFTNSGTVSPGFSPGILLFTGTYNQSAAGDLFIELAGTTVGTQYDRLQITGTANLGGDLLVDLSGTYVPLSTDTFTVLTATSVIGTFANTPAGVLMTSEGQFSVTYTATSVILSNFQMIPEPASVALLAFGGAVLMIARRRSIPRRSRGLH